MINKKIELLAPAGTKSAFIGAINAGANAVYISGKNYGARKFADNFSKEEIAELIEYAHLRNVLVYVTINTLIFEEELSELLKYSDFLVENNVDALIVQDLGVINEFIKRYPDTEIHASTQMNVYNLEQLKYLKKLGVSRVILARETSLETIIEMKNSVDMDLEVFIHGALCVSYSGNCLFSSMNGGRSGNRGECAQPCRMKYSLYKNDRQINSNSYLLSTKDLITIDKIHEIIKSGVSSLKIEGRMKKPEYVIATVKAYREAIDSYLEQTELQKSIINLKKVFNREYTKGYLLNEEPNKINNSFRPSHQGIKIGEVLSYNYGKTQIKLTDTLSLGDGIRILGKQDVGDQVNKIIKNNQIVNQAYQNDIVTIDLPKRVEPTDIVMKTMDFQYEESLKPYLSENYKIIELTGQLNCYLGKPIHLIIKTSYSEEVSIESEYIIEKAKNPNQTRDKLYTQFDKFGNTFYYLENFIVNSDELGFIPNNVLNTLRREAIDLLQKSILESKSRRIISHPIKKLNKKSEPKNQIVCKVETKEQLQAAIELGIENIYVTENIKDNNHILFMNRVWYDLQKYPDKLVIRDFGGITPNKAIVCDSSMNIINSKTIELLVEQGVDTLTVSNESSIYNTSKMLDNFYKLHKFVPNIEQTVYGKIDLMLSKYCPITKTENINKQNCNLCMRRDYELVDNDKNKYRIIKDGYCNVRILHHTPLNLIDYLDDLKNARVSKFRLDFTDEDYLETKLIIKAFMNKLNKKHYDMPYKPYTTGRFLK